MSNSVCLSISYAKSVQILSNMKDSFKNSLVYRFYFSPTCVIPPSKAMNGSVNYNKNNKKLQHQVSTVYVLLTFKQFFFFFFN